MKKFEIKKYTARQLDGFPQWTAKIYLPLWIPEIQLQPHHHWTFRPHRRPQRNSAARENGKMAKTVSYGENRWLIFSLLTIYHRDSQISLIIWNPILTPDGLLFLKSAAWRKSKSLAYPLFPLIDSKSTRVIKVQPNITAGMVIRVPLLKKLTSQEAITPAIICRLPNIADALPASKVKGFSANAVAFRLIKPSENKNRNTKPRVMAGPAMPAIVKIKSNNRL